MSPSPTFSYEVIVAKKLQLVKKNLFRIAFKIPFIEASQCLTGVDSYTILETKKIREIGRGHFASVIVARHNGKEYLLKEIFCKY